MPNFDNSTHDTLVTLTAGIVAAYVRKHVVPSVDVARIITDVHYALASIRISDGQSVAQVVEMPKPAVSIRKSVHEDYLICLEDGKKFVSLKRHLTTKFQLTPDQYREKWNLPEDYPMVAPAYALKRSELARSLGLGRRSKNLA